MIDLDVGKYGAFVWPAYAATAAALAWMIADSLIRARRWRREVERREDGRREAAPTGRDR
ncbi:MAG: heme exporter protein CcmD [Caulobacteraceae bacterium]|nr:heme exporter protein CcmD [Caulobacteraceae bacterium]